MRKKKDFRTVNEKIYDFAFSHRRKIIFWSFLLALSMFLISLFTSNKGGLLSLFLYPLAVMCFFLELHIEGGTKNFVKFFVPAIFMVMSIVLFILGFFLEI